MNDRDTESFRVRVRRYAGFIRSIASLHPRLFAVAVAGASVYAICTVGSSIAIEWVIDNAVVPRFDEGDVATATVITGCALIIGIGVLRAAGVVVRRSFAGMTQWRIAETLTGDVADRLVTQPLTWHQRHSDGQLVARGSVDVDTTIRVMAPIPFATSTVLMIVVAGIWLVVSDTVMGLVAIAIFPVLMIVNIVYERSVNRHFEEAQQALGDFSGAVHESFEAVQLVKAYGAEERETARLSERSGRIRDARVRAVHLRGIFEAMLEAIPSITNICLVVLGASRVQSGQVTIGELSGFIYLFTLLVFPLRLIGYALSELPQSYSGFARVRSVIDDPLDPDPEATIGPTAPPHVAELDDVCFAFAGGDSTTLSDVSIDLRQGTVTAIVGATGSGKSTLVDILGGLVPPTSGDVRLTTDPRTVVFQEAFLFGGSVRENVAVGAAIDDDQVWEALRLASAEQFVRDLPSGLDTLVGERGVTLSGGQRQRVALARALARRPALLLLDDTTSALDPATELVVLDNLRSSMTTTSVGMVASRPSTIALADDIVFIEGGRVAAHGSHDRLMRDVPGYRDLVEAFEADRAAPDESNAAPTAAFVAGGS